MEASLRRNKFSELRDRKPQIFVDLDGVLADLDGYYRETFGVDIDRSSPDQALFWNNINNYSRTAFGGHFYKELPLLSDALTLWRGVHMFHLNPIILTGGGDSRNYPETAEHKRWWVNKYLGYDVPMICCLSKEKAKHGQPGDILIDDWTKYRPVWQKMGGVFILHTSAEDSLRQLDEHYHDLLTGRG